MLVEVHPHGREHGKAEFVLSLRQAIQLWQGVVHPLDEGRHVMREAVFPQCLGWFYSHDVVALRRQPCGVGAGSGADIQGPCGRVRDQMEHCLMLVGKRKRFVAPDEFGRVRGVALRSANHSLVTRV